MFLHDCLSPIIISISQKLNASTMKQSSQENSLEVQGPSNTEHNGTAISLPYPFYYYQDFSNEPDLDPSVPLTAPGRVPNFPAKMHAILSRDDFS